MVNASCEFDVETLRPTYRLIFGMPGKSNAYAISLRLGMDPSIVERARQLTSGETQAFEEVLEEFERQRQEMEKQKAAAEREREQVNLMRAELELEKEHFRAQRDRELERATQETRRLVAMAREMYNRIIRELDEIKKQKDAENFGDKLYETKQKLRRDLRRAAEELDPVTALPQEPTVLPRPLRVGDTVHIRTLDKDAEVLALPDARGMVAVRAGIINTKVKLTDLTLVEEKGKAVERFLSSRSGGDKAVTSMRAELDLRGKNGDEGCYELDKYLDEAVLHGCRPSPSFTARGRARFAMRCANISRGIPMSRAFGAASTEKGKTASRWWSCAERAKRRRCAGTKAMKRQERKRSFLPFSKH